MGQYMFIIVPILVVIITVFTFVLILSPKARGKWMAQQVKATKYMLDNTEEDLKDISTRSANISKDGVEIIARAVKDGLTKERKYCKYCGEAIDEDSIFCKKCGKEQ